MTARSYETITVTTADGVAWVTLNRPEVHNSFNTTMIGELRDLWRGLRHDDDVNVAVLTGAGDRAFCTGIDRSEIRLDWADNLEPGAEGRDADDPLAVASPFMFDDPGQSIGPKSNDLWKPVIAAVNGMACGGAFYMLGEVDFIIAADHATFFDPHINYGMPTIFEPMHMLQRMPLGEILRISLLGNAERMTAERAYQVGLVSEVTTPEELADKAAWAAAQIASYAPLAVQATLRAVWTAREMGRSQALSMGSMMAALGTTTEGMEAGQRAFAAGERPRPRLR